MISQFRNKKIKISITLLLLILFILLINTIYEIFVSNYISAFDSYHEQVITSFKHRSRNLFLIADQIVSDPSIKNVLEQNNNHLYDSAIAQNTLSSKYLINNEIDELIIYDTKYKNIYSSGNMTAMPIELYSNSKFDLRELIAKYNKTKLAHIAIQNNALNPEHFYIFSVSSNRYIIFFRMNSNAISEAFNKNEAPFSASTCIYYNGFFFADSDNDYEFFSKIDLTKIQIKSDMRYENHMVFAQKNGNIFCISKIPLSVYIATLSKNLFLILVIIGLLIMLVYLTLHYLIKHFNKQISVATTLMHSNNTKSSLTKIFFEVPLYSHEYDALENIFLSDNICCKCIILKINHQSSQITNTDKTLNEETLRSIADDFKIYKNLMIFKLKKNMYAIIIIAEKEINDKELKKQIELFDQKLTSQFFCVAKYVVSNSYYNVNDFISLANNVVKLMERSVFFDMSVILFENDTDNYGAIIPYPFETEKKIFNSLDAHSYDTFFQLFDIFSKRISSATPNLAKNFMLVFANDIINYYRMSTHEVSEYLLEQINISNSFNAICQFIKNSIEELISSDESSSSLSDSSVFTCRVSEYISSSFQNPDFSIVDLATHLSLTPSYAGKKFKSNFGMSFNSYLSNIRIEKAKQILDDTQIKIVDISEQCGFRTVNYFISIFKKNVGITPQEYRNRFQKND